MSRRKKEEARKATLPAQQALADWLEEHNSGGFDFSKPPPRELIEKAFPEADSEQVDYWIRKPSRIYERFEDEVVTK